MQRAFVRMVKHVKSRGRIAEAARERDGNNKRRDRCNLDTDRRSSGGDHHRRSRTTNIISLRM